MEKAIEIVGKIKSILTGFEDADENKKALVIEIEEAIGRKLPDEIKSFYVNSSPELAVATVPVFMGYEPLDLESIAKMYRDPKGKSSCCFLGALSDLGSDLVLGGGEHFEIIQNLNGEVEDGFVISDMKTIVPVMSESGYYIVLLYKPNDQTELAIATEDFCLSSIAPSLNEYLQSLEEGIKKGIFEVDYDEEEDELEIDIPEVWSEILEAIN